MVYDMYSTNEIKDMLKSAKSMNTLISENSIKMINKNKRGATSSAEIYKFPNGKLYIVRKTPSSYVSKTTLENEIVIYKMLLSKPESNNYISKLVYGDSYLAGGTGDSYFIFEYENGDVLSDYIKKNINSLSIGEVMKIYNHLQNAITFLEENGVVHRDIKPDNIYYSTDRNIPLLFDFDASCYGQSCFSVEYTGSPEYSTPSSKIIRGHEGFSLNTRFYRYSSAFDKYSLAVILEKDLKKLVRDEDKEEIADIALKEKSKYNTENVTLQNIKGGNNRMIRNKTRKGGRIGVMNPTWGGKNKPENISESLLNISEVFTGGMCSDKGCLKMPMMQLPPGISLGPLTAGLKGGMRSGCGCQAVPKIPIPMGELPKEGYRGGYRPTAKNLKYLRKWKKGKSIGFTMRSSLKAKGLIPRANGTKRVSNKYRTF